MQTRNIFPEWGTEITDMSDLFEQDQHELRHLLYDRKMLVFHAPAWSKLEYWKFLALWGEPWDNVEYTKSNEHWEPIIDPSDGSTKYITSFSNKTSSRLGDREMPWHADASNRMSGINFPHRSLYMQTVPNLEAGYTYWLDIELAYPEIHPRLRERWEKRIIIQQDWYNLGQDINTTSSIKVHPITGKRSPRCNYHGSDDSWILDTKINEVSMGTGIVEEVIEAMAEVPNVVYEHRWNPMDIVLYDNWPLLHRRTDLGLKPDEERLIWRGTIDHDLNLRSRFLAS
jgi:alpha-ketoglutarate-dependent taurine dioxygenase